MMEKEKFLKDLNDAYLRADVDYIVDQVSDDVVWTIVGDEAIRGKEAFAEASRNMGDDTLVELTPVNIITHGKMAAVEGFMKMKFKSGEIKAYSFCDVYKFNGFKNPKIKELTSYIIEVKDHQN